MGLSDLATHSADLVAMGWSAITYIPWYMMSGAGHRISMHNRIKSREQQNISTRRASEHPKLITDFKGCDTLVGSLRQAVSEFADRPATGVRELIREEDEVQPNGRKFKKCVYGDYSWNSFAQLEQDVNSLAAGMTGLGLKKGDKVAIYMETRAEWLISAHAAFRAGLTVVTVYASLGEEAVEDALRESEASALVSSAPLLEKCGEGISKRLESLKFIIHCSHENINQERKLQKIDGKVQIVKYEDLKITNSDNYEPPEVVGDDLAVIMYTSGTTGKAKGVMILHRNLVACIGGLTSRLNISGITFTEDDCYIGYLPLAHVLELAAENVLLLNGCKIGYSSPLTLSDKSAKIKSGSLGDARALQPTLMTAVPEILERIRKAVHAQVKEGSFLKRTLFNYAYEYKRQQVAVGGDSPIFNSIIFSKTRALLGGKLKCMIAGGAPVDVKTQQFMSICMSCPLVIGYGLTETCAGGSVQDAFDYSSGRVGPPLGCCEIKLIDWEEGNYFTSSNPPQGEILIGGPNVTNGYFKMEEKTKEDYTEIDGIRYFKTGDIGQWEQDGALRIIDRKKDLCKMRHGEYLALGKVEAVLKTSAAVNNILIYGSGDLLFPLAVIVPVEKVIMEWAGELGISGTLKEVCQNDEILKRMTVQIGLTAKSAGLVKTEIPAKIHIDGSFEAGWLPDSGLVTDAFKLKRRQLNDHYKDNISKMAK